MNVDEFEKIIESWRSYILVDALQDYSLEIDEDVPKEFAAIALYLDTTTVRAAGETTEYYDGYRRAATDVLNLLGLQMVQDDEMRIKKNYLNSTYGDRFWNLTSIILEE